MKTSSTTVFNPPKVLSFAENPTSTALVPAGSAPSAAPGTAPATEPSCFGLQFPSDPLALSQTPAAQKKRNGKVAQLPKPEREMLNLMLRDNQPYACIESALHVRGFTVSQRNISNWKTHGGYNEWCAAQAQALELRGFQDNLTDFLRRHDAAELSEVGLQSAATNVSAILLRPDLMRELLADPEKYSKLIELQCRLAREIQALQKYRDEASKLVGGHPERDRRDHERSVEETRRIMCANTDPSQGHLVLPENFMPKPFEPLRLFTFSEKERLQRFENLFKPGPDNPLTKRKALTAPPPPSPTLGAPTPNQNVPANIQPPSPEPTPAPHQSAADRQSSAADAEQTAGSRQQSAGNPNGSPVPPGESAVNPSLSGVDPELFPTWG